MNPMNVKPKDWEALSGYVDGMLSSRERIKIEQRLEDEPVLQEALSQLKSTRAVLRSTPKIRTRRSFTLTPEMVGVSRHGKAGYGTLYGFFRLAFAVASILFIFTFSADIAGFGVPRNEGQQDVVFRVEEEQVAAVAESAAPAAEAPVEAPAEEPMMMVMPTDAAAESPAGEGEAAVASVPEAAEMERIAVVEETEAPAEKVGAPPGVQSVPFDAGGGGGEPDGTANQNSAQTGIAEIPSVVDETSSTAALETGIEGYPEPVVEPEVGSETVASVDPAAVDQKTGDPDEFPPEPAPVFQMPLLRMLEVGLAILVLISGLGLVYLRRR